MPDFLWKWSVPVAVVVIAACSGKNGSPAEVVVSDAADSLRGDLSVPETNDEWPLRIGVGQTVVTPEFEPFTDSNGNHHYDDGEPFEDLDEDGVLDTLFIGGFGHRNPTGIHDDLYARTIALEVNGTVFTLTAVDSLGLGMQRADNAKALVLAALGGSAPVTFETMVIASTHTHQGPDTMGIFGSDGESGADPAYLTTVEERVSQSILAALADLQPARLYMASTTDSADLIRDIDLPVILDPYVGILQGETLTGEVIATLVSVANHPEACWGDNTLISSDYPHFLRSGIEAQVGGMALYFSADLGLMQTPVELGAAGFERAELVGAAYAEKILAALPSRTEIPAADLVVSSGYFRATVELENPELYIAVFSGLTDGYSDYLYTTDAPPCSFLGCIDLPIFVARLGDFTTIVSFPGELTPELVVGGIRSPDNYAGKYRYAPPEPVVTEHLETEHRFIIGLGDAATGYFYPKMTFDPEAHFSQKHAAGPNAAMSLLQAFADAMADINEEFSDGQLEPPPTPGLCAINNEAFPVRPEIGLPATLPFLHVEGREIVDDEGNAVALRGVNFGSWLMLESWIAGIGTTLEGELLEKLRAKAHQLGIDGLLQDAETANMLDWLLESKSHYVLVKEWRAQMEAAATPEQESAVAKLWAWFDEQAWVEEEESVWNWLTHRFGYAASEELRLTFQHNYITEVDVERVAALGLNLIRVPIWYRSLETDFATDNHFRAEGWQMLHELGLWARQHGVYLMLDLHGAPGGQSTSWHQGLADGGHLWENPACIARTARVWQALATFFADDPHVAIYDFLNEPMNFPEPEDYRAVHDAIYQAVREIDTQHIVMIEDAYRPFSQLTSPLEMGWDNAMFSVHRYPGGASADDYLANIEKGLTDLEPFYFERFDCPLFMGEFSGADGTDSDGWAAASMELVLARLNERGVHWAPWTWKYYADSTWGLYHPAEGAGSRIDVQEASFTAIKAALQGLHSGNFVPDEAYEKALSQNAAAPLFPLNLGDLSGD